METVPSDFPAIIQAVNEESGVKGSSISIEIVRPNNGVSQRNLHIDVSVEEETFSNQARVDQLDASIKQRAKALYKDIDTIDYITVTFISSGHAGPVSIAKKYSTVPSSPSMIADR